MKLTRSKNVRLIFSDYESVSLSGSKTVKISLTFLLLVSFIGQFTTQFLHRVDEDKQIILKNPIFPHRISLASNEKQKTMKNDEKSNFLAKKEPNPENFINDFES